MKKLLLIIGIIIVAVILTNIAKHDRALQEEVYVLLEQDTLTDNERERIQFLTDPSMMKESYVVLDEKHNKLFEAHFGYKR